MGALVQWSNLPAWKVGYHGLEPRSSIQVSNKQDMSSPLTRNLDSLLWEASVIERWRARYQTAKARISNPVSGGQCHFIHLIIPYILNSTFSFNFKWVKITHIF